MLHNRLRRAFIGALAILALCAGSVVSVRAQNAISVRYENGMHLRSLALKYLGDSDLWPEILRTSGVKAVADLTPGMILKVPVGTIKSAKQALNKSLVKIQDANQAGAQLFAPKLIGSAISYRNDALKQQVASEWNATIELASRSFSTAQEAVMLSKSHRDQSAEARLSDRQGRVQGQRPTELSWSRRKRDATLIEEEKIRTLSDSTAQVTFRDASRLRLNANSQAVIQLMRIDPLNNREVAKVNLISGDFYALFNAKSVRKKFKVELPNVDARIDSGNFWVRHKRGEAKFTNYDDRPVRIAARGKSITLGRNEGAVVQAGGIPQAKFDVLPAPVAKKPADKQRIYGDRVLVGWLAVDGARGYWVELAADPGFNRMIESRWGMRELEMGSKPLKPGHYYWRVAALDRSGVPGARSAGWHFEIQEDRTPPFLNIAKPVERAIVRTPEVELAGETEPHVSLIVNDQPVPVGKTGSYSQIIKAAEGLNQIEITAIDRAGNRIKKTRSFTFMPDISAVVRFSRNLPRHGARHFLAAGKTVSLSGDTTADAKIVFLASNGAERAAAYSDANGRFRINVPVGEQSEKLVVRIIARSGHASAVDIMVSQDRTPPKIELDEPLPRFTQLETLILKGKTEKGVQLTLNGKPVAVENGKFAAPVKLKDGKNRFDMIATDAVGHVTIENWSIRLDRHPPKLLGHSIHSKISGRNALVTVSLTANDPAGLAGIATFELSAGDRNYSGYLRYNRASKTYQGILQVPADDARKAQLLEVGLRDSAGNKVKVKLN